MGWYNSLTTPEKVYFYIAIIGTVLLIVQIIMMLFSFGGGADADTDADFGGDGDFDSPDGDLGISLFTLQRDHFLSGHRRLGGSARFANQFRKYRAVRHFGYRMRFCRDAVGGARHAGAVQIAEQRQF